MTAAETETAAVRALVEAWAAAVRRKDLDGVVARHSDNVVFFDVPPPAQVLGIDAYGDAWRDFLSWVTAFDLQALEVVASESVAFCHGIVRCAGATEPAPFDVRLTMGLRKIEGEWLVTHEHHSVPAPSDA